MAERHLITLVGAISLAIALSGCGGDSADSPDNGMPLVDTGAGLDAGSSADVGKPSDMTAPLDLSDDMGVVDACDDCQPDLSNDTGTADMGTDAAQTIGELCFPDRNDPDVPGPNYDQFTPRVGAHCLGTNHQHVWGVEQVVFLGDSVTVGTPPTLSQDFYRTRLATWLANEFNLEEPGYLWQIYNPDTGTSTIQESGDFKNCSKWGARTDDLLEGGEQIPTCFPDGGSDKRTLIVMTMGGNDIAKITEAGGAGGKSLAEVTAMTETAVAHMEDAVTWLTDPQNFPNGSFVLFANPFEFTDGTGDTSTCPAAGVAGLEEWDDPQDLADLVIWFNEQFMRIAVETETDMIFMLENFCGHGFAATGNNPDSDARCYLGPNTARWFDDTCIHPNPTGHEVIADMFEAVVREPGMAP